MEFFVSTIQKIICGYRKTSESTKTFEPTEISKLENFEHLEKNPLEALISAEV